MAERHEWRILAILLILILAFTGFYYFRNTKHIAGQLTMPSPDLSGMEPRVAAKIRRLMENVKQNPSSAEAWGRLGMTLDVHGLKEDGIRSYQKASEIGSADFRWSYYCAIALKENGNPQALSWFAKAAGLNPRYVPLQVRYATALMDAGRPSDAQQHFDQAISLQAQSAESYLGLAQIALSRNDVERGKDYAKKAIAIKPDLTDAYHVLALADRRLGETEEAEKAIAATKDLPEKTALVDPVYAQIAAEGESAFWYRTRGRLYLESGLYELAYQQYQTALKLHPDADAYDNLGVALQGLGRLDEAIENHKKAIAMSPTFLKYYNLGIAYAKEAKIEPAIDAFGQSIKMKPDNPEAYFNLGVAYFKQEQYQKAVDALQQAIRYKPSHMEAHRALALSYMALGQKQKAEEEYELLNREGAKQKN